MKRHNTLITRYYLSIACTMFFFILIGVGISNYLINIRLAEHEAAPPLFIAKMIDILGGENKALGIRRYMDLKAGARGPDLDLLDGQGRVIYSTRLTSKVVPQNDLQALVKPYDYKQLNNHKSHKHPALLHILRVHKWRSLFLVRLAGEPVTYLKIIPSHYLHEEKRLIPFFAIAIGVLVISMLIGVYVSVLLIYRTISKYTKIANHVISDLQNGNLKARFPIDHLDEFGRLMLNFNQMAGEIEQVVLSSRRAENVRINLLQELAHDLKTPISSLKTLLETLETKEDVLDEQLKKELLQLSRKEVDYFARLMDDLLLLAQMSEPRYQIHREMLDLTQLLTEKLDDTEFRESQTNHKTIVKKFPDVGCQVFGDRHLLQRAFRNALENAIYHATQLVTVDIERIDERRLRVIFQDDGHGFSSETRQFFGERLVSRKISDEKGVKVSYGLGSVVIKTVCELHAANLVINNVIDTANQVLGARLEIDLPAL